MKVVMKKTLASPRRSAQPGEVINVPRAEARELIEAGAAVEAKRDSERRRRSRPAAADESEQGEQDSEGDEGEVDLTTAKIDDVLAYVGDDGDRAAEALHIEVNHRARPTLVERLEAIIAAADESEQGEQDSEGDEGSETESDWSDEG